MTNETLEKTCSKSALKQTATAGVALAAGGAGFGFVWGGGPLGAAVGGVLTTVAYGIFKAGDAYDNAYAHCMLNNGESELADIVSYPASLDDERTPSITPKVEPLKPADFGKGLVIRW